MEATHFAISRTKSSSLLRLDVHLLSLSMSYFENDLKTILCLLSSCKYIHHTVTNESTLWIGWLSRLADLSPSERTYATQFIYKYNTKTSRGIKEKKEKNKDEEDFSAFSSFRSIRNNGIRFVNLLVKSEQCNESMYDFFMQELISLPNSSQFFILSILKVFIMAFRYSPSSLQGYKSAADCLLLPLFSDTFNRISPSIFKRLHHQLCTEYQCIQWRKLISKYEGSPEECFYEDGLLIISRYQLRPELDSLSVLLDEMVINVWKELNLLSKECQSVAGTLHIHF